MEAAGQHNDQLSSAMSDIVHNYIDSKIERLSSLHDHLNSKDNEFKSDIMAAGIQNAIENHKHLKQHLIAKKHHNSNHKNALRKLAMGAMATFGIFSGVKASDIQAAAEPQQPSRSVQSVSVETQTSVSESDSQFRIQALESLVAQLKDDLESKELECSKLKRQLQAQVEISQTYKTSLDRHVERSTKSTNEFLDQINRLTTQESTLKQEIQSLKAQLQSQEATGSAAPAASQTASLQSISNRPSASIDEQMFELQRQMDQLRLLQQAQQNEQNEQNELSTTNMVYR